MRLRSACVLSICIGEDTSPSHSRLLHSRKVKNTMIFSFISFYSVALLRFHFYALSFVTVGNIKSSNLNVSSVRCAYVLVHVRIKNNQNSSIECNSVVKHFHMTNVQGEDDLLESSPIRIPCSLFFCLRKQATICNI